MTESKSRAVEDYYDARVAEKLRDFTHPLPRIEAAIQTLAEWAPFNPRRILEIGCGIGATAWRMARAWPRAEVIGTDISTRSIEVANICFRRPNLKYRAGEVDKDTLGGEFDLILMMDVYEHIPLSGRSALHAALNALLSSDARLILMVPTPAMQSYLRIHRPELIQPVDEDIDLPEIAVLARESGSELLYYRKVGVWHYGDYFHLVLGKYQNRAIVALRQYRPVGVAAIKQKAKKLLGRIETDPEGLRDYFGADLLRPTPPQFAKRFHVSLAERRKLVSAWRGVGNAGANPRLAN